MFIEPVGVYIPEVIRSEKKGYRYKKHLMVQMFMENRQLYRKGARMEE